VCLCARASLTQGCKHALTNSHALHSGRVHGLDEHHVLQFALLVLLEAVRQALRVRVFEIDGLEMMCNLCSGMIVQSLSSSGTCLEDNEMDISRGFKTRRRMGEDRHLQ